MNQLIINFDATGFEGFETPNEFFAFCSRTLKDADGRTLKGHYQAADMDMSPSQWSQKLHCGNNTSITLNEAFEYAKKFGDWRWLDYGNWMRSQMQADNVDALLAQRAELDRMIAAKKKRAA